MRNASMFALHDLDWEQEEHDDAPVLMHKGAKITDDEYGILDVTGLSDEEDNSEEGGQILSANFTSEVRVLRMHRADANDIESDDQESTRGRRVRRKQKRTNSQRIVTPLPNDLADVYAVENRFAIDDEEEKVEGDAEDGDDNEEVDESEEEKFETYSVLRT
ncbi:unnamed protein product [Peronospora farinosa]|uniref:Uncharacterized protein n=1 Tax=Peronospora farinosa TaxID=134698 RepID=A0ABN8C3E7_9STRA|nr:unnamed protein product [Peronospora farinosa]